MKNIMIALKHFAIIYLIYLTFLFIFQRKMIFPGTSLERDNTYKSHKPGFEIIWLETSFGKIEAWFANSLKENKNTKTILFAHGNYELIDHNLEILDEYTNSGYNFFIIEFPGYGDSSGKPTKKTIDESFEKAHDWLVKTKKINPKNIIYHAKSVGGGPLCSLAEKKMPAALILQSTYSDLGKFTIRYGAPPFLLLDRYNNLKIVKKLDCPILIIHGKNDSLIPYSHAEELKKYSKKPILLSFDTDHNDFLPALPGYWERIFDFINSNVN